MRNTKRVTLIITAALIILTPLSVKAEYITDTKDTLRGIKNILVVVKIFSQEAQKYALTKDKIQKDIELKLETAGIEIIPLKNYPTLKPYLLIKINTAYNRLGLFAYSSLVELKQLVFLGSSPDLSFDAITWSKIKTGTAKERELEETVRSSVKDLMDTFINDYLTVNPKQNSNLQEGVGNNVPFVLNRKDKAYIVDRRGEQWDITQAVSIGFKPEKFQYGLGRNAITPLDDSSLRNNFLKAPSDMRIIGITENSDARAYSVPKLSRHEVANSTIGSKPIAAAY